MRVISVGNLCISLFVLYFLNPLLAVAEEAPSSPAMPVLSEAAMCEAIEKFVPVNEAVAFSLDRGQVFCFTTFDPVPEKYRIYHKWYHKGVLITVKRLTLNPPRWSSISSIQLRGTDIGPWQVDITDKDGKIFETLRFSITE